MIARDTSRIDTAIASARSAAAACLEEGEIAEAIGAVDLTLVRGALAAVTHAALASEAEAVDVDSVCETLTVAVGLFEDAAAVMRVQRGGGF